MKRQQAFDVYLNGQWLDTVFFPVGHYTEADVKQSLINHDGYSPAIQVLMRRNSKGQPN